MSRVIDCFLLQPTGKVRRSLRRYCSGSSCAGESSYHNAHVPIGEADCADHGGEPEELGIGRDDQRWPAACSCGYVFSEEDRWQVFDRKIYRRADTGAEMTLEEAPAGAMWDLEHMHDYPAWCGPDGRSYTVRTPGGDWMIDSRANNCTMKDDDVHKCWVRHGVAPQLTVDKNGHTCAAGGGSILCGSYHGFLVAGQLREC